jgi:hypothetical protein
VGGDLCGGGDAGADGGNGGKWVIILRGKRPAVKLVPVGDRAWGRYEGAVRVARDFDAADAGLEALFEDAPIEPAANG